MKKHIYFVRHGESDTNIDGVYRGSDAQLTPQGAEQARAVARRIERIGVEALVSSPYPRARGTADSIATLAGLEIEESPLFIERVRPSMLMGNNYGDPAVVSMSQEVFEGYLIDGYRHSDEENQDDLAQRAKSAFTFLEEHPKGRICVVTHGLFLKILFAYLWTDGAMHGRDIQRAIKFLEVDNTGITYAQFQSDPPFLNALGTYASRWRMVTWNDTAHL